MIIGEFEKRREAELAVEHLVQEHGLQRSAVSVHAAGSANTAGSRISGADVESGHPGVDKHGKPELSGQIEIVVECGQAQATIVEAALKDAGARQLRSQSSGP
jgi:hypothetical protein